MLIRTPPALIFRMQIFVSFLFEVFEYKVEANQEPSIEDIVAQCRLVVKKGKIEIDSQKHIDQQPQQ